MTLWDCLIIATALLLMSTRLKMRRLKDEMHLFYMIREDCDKCIICGCKQEQAETRSRGIPHHYCIVCDDCKKAVTAFKSITQ